MKTATQGGVLSLDVICHLLQVCLWKQPCVKEIMIVMITVVVKVVVVVVVVVVGAAVVAAAAAAAAATGLQVVLHVLEFWHGVY